MTRFRIVGWNAVAMLAMASVLNLGACTRDQNTLPSITQPTGTSESQLEAVAKAYFDCMTDAGISVRLQPNAQGELAVVSFMENDSFMYHNAYGGGWSGDIDLSDPAAQEFMSSTSREPALILNGVDRSEVYSQCIDRTGYEENAANGEIAKDAEQLQLQVTANNVWAGCARENGFPDVADSVMPNSLTDDDWPAIVLPATITEDQIRQLTAVCPLVGAQQPPEPTDLSGGYLPVPNVSFDLPFLTNHDPAWTPGDDELAQIEHAQKLYDVLYEGVAR